jgi:hypothetical protein
MILCGCKQASGSKCCAEGCDRYRKLQPASTYRTPWERTGWKKARDIERSTPIK